MPIQVSTPIRSKIAGACSGASVSFSRRGCSRWPSASWDDYQKYASELCCHSASVGRRQVGDVRAIRVDCADTFFARQLGAALSCRQPGRG
jgi:hypothetical protein